MTSPSITTATATATTSTATTPTMVSSLMAAQQQTSPSPLLTTESQLFDSFLEGLNWGDPSVQGANAPSVSNQNPYFDYHQEKSIASVRWDGRGCGYLTLSADAAATTLSWYYRRPLNTDAVCDDVWLALHSPFANDM